MLRRATSLWVLLAVTGCGTFRAWTGEEEPEPTQPIVRPMNKAINSSSMATPSASTAPTAVPASSNPQIQMAQATVKASRERVYEPPIPPIMPDEQPVFPKTKTEVPPPAPPPEAPVLRALKCMLEGRHAEALAHLQAYDPETREVLLGMLPMLSLLSEKPVEKLNPEDVGVLEQQIRDLLNSIRSRAALSISKLCFCDAIKGYAVYRPLPEEHAFLAARNDRPGELVQLYVEMKNLGSRQEGPQFVTDLGCEVEIVDETGRSRWSHRFRPEDLRLTRRSRLIDYYHNLSFYLPAGIGAGNYRLTVRLADRTQPDAPREAASTVPFRVVADRQQP